MRALLAVRMRAHRLIKSVSSVTAQLPADNEIKHLSDCSPNGGDKADALLLLAHSQKQRVLQNIKEFISLSKTIQENPQFFCENAN